MIFGISTKSYIDVNLSVWLRERMKEIGCMMIVDFIFQRNKNKRKVVFKKKKKRERESITDLYIYIYGKEEKNVFITFWTPRIMTHACRRKK